MRPIDGEDLLRKICGDSCGCEPSDCGYIDEYRKERCKAGQYVEKQPTVDAIPVKHGRWEGDETCDAYDIAGVKTWAVKRKCSICGFTHKFIEAHMCYEFCPNCGAKMDLEG